jgi:hypothetical protein
LVVEVLEAATRFLLDGLRRWHTIRLPHAAWIDRIIPSGSIDRLFGMLSVCLVCGSLRSLCTSFLIQHSDEVELLSLLHIATLYSLPRLEHHCLSVRPASCFVLGCILVLPNPA